MPSLWLHLAVSSHHMKRTILSAFKENLGKVEFAIDHHTFTRLGKASLHIMIWKSSDVNDELSIDITKSFSFHQYKILERIHQYQIEKGIQPELINASAYKALEKVLVQHGKYPFVFFYALKKKHLKEIEQMEASKSIALANERRDITHYQDIFVFDYTERELIELKDQNLYLMMEGAFDLEGTPNSYVTIENGLTGDIRAGNVALGPKSKMEGDIKADQLIIVPGAYLAGQVTLNGKDES